MIREENKDSGMVRQGDVLVRKVNRKTIPKGALKQEREEGNRVVLAYGEVTGHAHAYYEDTVTKYTTPDKVYLKVTETTPLKHEEHTAIDFVKGIYEVITQREYWDDSWRKVAD